MIFVSTLKPFSNFASRLLLAFKRMQGTFNRSQFRELHTSRKSSPNSCAGMTAKSGGLMPLYDAQHAIRRWRNSEIVELLPRAKLRFQPKWHHAPSGPCLGRLRGVHIFRIYRWVWSPRAIHGLRVLLRRKQAQSLIELCLFSRQFPSQDRVDLLAK